MFVLNAAPRPPTSPGATTCGATCQECNIKFGRGGRGVNELKAVALPKIVEISLLAEKSKIIILDILSYLHEFNSAMNLVMH